MVQPIDRLRNQLYSVTMANAKPDRIVCEDDRTQVTLLRQASPLSRLDIGPWILLHGTLLWLWWSGQSAGPYSFLHALGVFFAVLGHSLTALAQHWSVHAWRQIAYVKANSIESATHVYARTATAQRSNNGDKPPGAAVVALERMDVRAATESGVPSHTARSMLELPPYRFTWHSLTYELRPSVDADRQFREWLATPGSNALPTKLQLADYANWAVARRGWTDPEAFTISTRFGPNAMPVPLPSFGRLFLEHATAPFFVFQIACVGLWCLDEYVWYSLFTLGTLVAMEATLVGQRIATARQLRSMRPPPHPVWALRGGVWRVLQSQLLLPFDVISVAREPAAEKTRGTPAASHPSPSTVPCPADVLLLTGTVVVNEAMLTGESTPQIKEAPPDMAGQAAQAALDAFTDGSDRIHSQHIVFSGTLVVTAAGAQEDTGGGASGIPAPPDGGAVAVVLRTGPHTSQGELLRSILQGQERISVADREAFVFIGCMLVFAIAAAYYVLTAGLADPRRDRWKLGLHVIMILTTVVPPELPVELSMAVNMSLAGLIRRGIFCTEPNRIPAAGKVDVVAFDKTGTLTADRFRVQGVALLGVQMSSTNSGEVPPPALVTGPAGLPAATQLVMVGCHALIAVKIQESIPAQGKPPGGSAPQTSALTSRTEYAGDPIEKAALDAVGWVVDEAGIARPKIIEGGEFMQSVLAGVGAGPAVKVVHRWPFSSALKRMTCAVTLQGTALDMLQKTASQPPVLQGGIPAAEQQHRVEDASADAQLLSASAGSTYLVTKGAPEVLEALLSVVPPGYARTHARLAASGARVLALAYRVLGKATTVASLRTMDRTAAEAPRSLTFAGFLCVSSPLKTDSLRVVTELLAADYHVLMITGDAPLTALAVAGQLSMGDAGAAGTHVLDLEQDVGQSDIGLVLISPNDPEKLPLTASSMVHMEQQLVPKSLLAVTGRALDVVQRKWGADAFASLCMRATIFARTSPAQKERIIGAINDSSLTGGPLHYTAMVGDGSNDTGALKRAHLGLAVLSNTKLEDRYDRDRLERAAKRRSNPAQTGSAVARALGVDPGEDDGEVEALLKSEQERTASMMSSYGSHEAEEPESQSLTAKLMESAMKAASTSSAGTTGDGKAQLESLQARIKAMEAESAAEGGMGGPPIVALGDASMAAPLTSKLPTPAAILDVLRQGRCTLVTTHQMFKILGVNALVAAYMMSVLHLANVKLGDNQMTMTAMSAAGCFFFISWAKPIRRLSKEKPHTSVFHTGLVMSVLGQFAIHTASLLAASALVGHNPWIVAEPSMEEMADAVANASFADIGAGTLPGLDPFIDADVEGITGKGLLTSKLFGNVDAASAATSTSDSWWGADVLIPPSTFKPSHVNTAVFLVYAAAQACTFVVSYHGPPFMEELQKQTSLWRTSACIYAACIVGAMGIIPELNSYLQLLPLETTSQRLQLVGLIVLDGVACAVIETISRITDRWCRRRA